MAEFFEIWRDYYREVATALKQLAHQTGFPSVRRNLVSLAKRYDLMADYCDNRPVTPSPPYLGDQGRGA